MSTDDLDLARLAEIPDPYAAPAPVRAAAPKGLAPSPARARVHQLRVGALVVALLSEVVWTVLVEHRPDLGTASRTSLALGLGIPLAAAVVALPAASRRGPFGLGESARRLAVLVGVSLVVFLVGTAMRPALAVQASPPDAEQVGFWSHTLRCALITAVLAAAPLALGLGVFRHAFVSSARLRSAGIGVAAGALAAATMSIVCSTDGVVHVLLGHGTMMIAGGLAGLLLGKKITQA
jgi:hypothetical protein